MEFHFFTTIEYFISIQSTYIEPLDVFTLGEQFCTPL